MGRRGRPKGAPKVVLCLRVAPETAEALREEAARLKAAASKRGQASLSGLVEELILEGLKMREASYGGE